MSEIIYHPRITHFSEHAGDHVFQEGDNEENYIFNLQYNLYRY